MMYTVGKVLGDELSENELLGVGAVNKGESANGEFSNGATELIAVKLTGITNLASVLYQPRLASDFITAAASLFAVISGSH